MERAPETAVQTSCTRRKRPLLPCPARSVIHEARRSRAGRRTGGDERGAEPFRAYARMSAVSGIVFAGLFVAALVLVRQAPGIAAPDRVYADFYTVGNGERARDGRAVHRAVRGDRLPVAHERDANAHRVAARVVVRGPAMAAARFGRALRLHALRGYGGRGCRGPADGLLLTPPSVPRGGAHAHRRRLRHGLRLRRPRRRHVHDHDDHLDPAAWAASTLGGGRGLPRRHVPAPQHHLPPGDPAGVPRLGAAAQRRAPRRRRPTPRLRRTRTGRLRLLPTSPTDPRPEDLP